MNGCAAVLLAWFVLGMSGAFAQTAPRTAAPVLQAPAPDARPYIDGYDVLDCAAPGQAITVRGRHLGPRGTRRAVLAAHNLHIDLEAVRWGEHALTVTLPQDRRIVPGERYFIGIEGERHGRWLSNVDKYLEICAPAVRAARPATAVAVDPPPERPVPDPEPRTPPAEPEPSPPAGRGDGGPAPSSAPPEDDAAETVSPAADAPQGNPFDRGTGSGSGLAAPAPLLQVASGEDAEDPDDVEPAELLAWHPDLDAAQDFAAELQALGWSVRRRLVLPGLGVVQTTVGLPPGTGVAAARERLRTQFPDLLVDANHLYAPLDGPLAAPDPVPLRLVGWPPAAGGCASGRRVGVIDTLAAADHPAFRERDFETHRVPPAGIELGDDRHGTAVAARIAELLPDAALRVAGVFRRRADDEADTTAEWLLLALEWLLNERVDAVNMSLGGPGNRLLAAGIERLAARGIGAVAAVGDRGPASPPVYPAALPDVIGVTAVSRDLRVYRRARHGDEVDLAAPGVDVRFLQADGSPIWLTGTSYAAPFVTAALVLAGDRDILLAGAEDLGAPGRDAIYGAGLVRFDRLCEGAH